ncbi:uncharacterized protein LOC119297747 isoform X1 [Triticum dicoccoides]|uniref:uncharacterized protein LOC119297747 isoform X1 n=1 Tax=Triticum dicoccoides TaxID=85692 RepID=UPI00188EE4FD|nr:uncharacterized protein LOC119297747 isoform X1 [Triticum dicoccoides]
MRLICDGCVPIKSMVGLMCPSIRDPLAELIFSMADWCSMLVGAIVCGCAVADVQEASVVSVLRRPCLSSICSSSQFKSGNFSWAIVCTWSLWLLWAFFDAWESELIKWR